MAGPWEKYQNQPQSLDDFPKGTPYAKAMQYLLGDDKAPEMGTPEYASGRADPSMDVMDVIPPEMAGALAAKVATLGAGHLAAMKAAPMLMAGGMKMVGKDAAEAGS